MAGGNASPATRADCLEGRIAENAAAQQVDLTSWIFDHLSIAPGSRILELCCGTGGQTLKLIDLVGPSGEIVAMDASPDALDVLRSRIAPSDATRVSLLKGNIDSIGAVLSAHGIRRGFDMVFCAYGLYYSRDAEVTLREARDLLNDGGRIVIIGPFGPNNGPLFELLVQSGVTLSDAVTFSSGRFMHETVVPWGSGSFRSLRLHTLVNPVRWPSADHVLRYWRSSTFYSEDCRADVESRLARHFESHPAFVNEKWIMMVEMLETRAQG